MTDYTFGPSRSLNWLDLYIFQLWKCISRSNYAYKKHNHIYSVNVSHFIFRIMNLRLNLLALLGLLPIFVNAIPNPQVDPKQIGTGQYTESDTPINDDVIEELFGGHGNPLNQNYKPPKPENIKVSDEFWK